MKPERIQVWLKKAAEWVVRFLGASGGTNKSPDSDSDGPKKLE